MILKNIKIGMFVREEISGEKVKVIGIKETKHYGPQRIVCVKFSNRHTEYYSPEDLTKEDTDG